MNVPVTNHLDALAARLLQAQETVMDSWRARVRSLPSARQVDLPTLNDHMPVWLRELAASLVAAAAANADDTAPAIPRIHGLQRFDDGFDIEEVVAEYNIMRDCVHELAERHEIALVGLTRHVVNKEFDDAIGAAVKAFAQSQAREVQRRRAEHLAFIAHDLRTPLSAITFASAIVEQRLPAESVDREIARCLKALGRNAKQLESLVTQVLKENTNLLTELGVKVERRTFDLWPMVESLLQDTQLLAAKSGTRLENAVPEELQVRADAGLLRRILQNLISNAIAYAAGGRVIVGARDLGPLDAVECWVRDDGAGIAPDRLPKVFDALETDPERNGLGLGLAIVKTFVEAHDGVVQVESAEGQGATFRFTLPRCVSAPAARESVTP
jgi:two-component system phosphate regulon sensor histidine kinase PhoR